ncbi:secretion protein HlyD [Candidatus Berkiella aquae]|uniref:Multidrug export protein EmrA n=1 Tax=Candidatus Berkiella aquae TaxID=295108 RepID=A0A0Q9Z082_9GAMM|nr:secretion protein HlyD [Candidatus Berkiella aquae]MCS5712360.1 secretion protein HlyD [Candidatus Berkiella aquae]
MKKARILLAIGALAIAAGYVYYTQHDHFPKDEIHLFGNVDIRQVELGFRVKGRLLKMLHEEGDYVHQGDKLALLDKEPFDIEAANQKAQLAQADANLQKLQKGNRPQEIQQAMAAVREKEASFINANRSLERQADLVRKNLASKQTYDDALTQKKETEAQLKTAKEALALATEGFRAEDIAQGIAQFDAAKARLANAELNVTDTELFAPSNGIILTRIREPGSIVEIGTPVYTLSLVNPIQVRAYITETELGKVKPGMEALIYIDAYPDTPIKGQVGFISPQAEFTPKNVETRALRTDLVYRIRIVVDDKNGVLRQGMPVSIVLKQNTMNNQVLEKNPDVIRNPH